MTVIPSSAQRGRTPLLILCNNTSVTVEMMQALHTFHPAAAGEKDQVRLQPRSTHARFDRRLVHRAD